MPERRPRDWLAIAAAAYLAANLLHGADHLRQHLAGLDVAVKIGGALLTMGAVATFARRHDPRAPLLAIAVGFSSAALVVASHLTPHWSVLSDSYIDDVHPDALSWAVVLVEIGTAFLLGVAGLYAERARTRGEQALA